MFDLQKTQIGQTVNKLRKANSDDKVASLTRVLLIKWKTQLPNSKVKDLTNKGKANSHLIIGNNFHWF